MRWEKAEQLQVLRDPDAVPVSMDSHMDMRARWMTSDRPCMNDPKHVDISEGLRRLTGRLGSFLMPETGQMCFLIHNSCWDILRDYYEPAPVPVQEIFDICASLHVQRDCGDEEYDEGLLHPSILPWAALFWGHTKKVFFTDMGNAEKPRRFSIDPNHLDPGKLTHVAGIHDGYTMEVC